MCFIISKEQSKKKKSPKDIRCYKMMLVSESNGKLIPFVFPEENPLGYTIGKVYRATLNNSPISEFVLRTSRDKKFSIIREGFHSYKYQNSSQEYALESNLHLIECTIPANTPYYENEREYVSLDIIFKEIL